MRVRFKGEADGLPCHVFGQDFPAGEWVNFDGPAGASKKLSGNPMFDVEGYEDPFDHDGNGSPGGSTAPAPEADLSDLRKAYTEALGKRPFPGWDADTLREKMAAAAPAPEAEPQPEPDPEEADDLTEDED